MPVTFKAANVKYKNSQGEYVGVNSVSDNTTSDQLAAIQNAGVTQIAAVQAKGTEVLDTIPDDYTELANDVESVKSAITLAPTLDQSKTTAIAENTDLNTITTLGNYKIASESISNSLSNAPSGFQYGRLFVMNGQSATRLLQIMLESSTTPQMWMRYYNGTEWQSWYRFDIGLKDVVDDIPDMLESGVFALDRQYATELTTEDLDTLFTTGNYLVTSSTTATAEKHYPAGILYGKIFVSGIHAENRTVQIALFVSYGSKVKIWYRYHNGSTWGDWVDVAINQRDAELDKCYWRLGYLSSGYPVEINDSDTTKRIVSDYIFVGKNTRIYIADADYDFNLALYDINRVYTGNDPSSRTWSNSTLADRVITEDCYIRITIRKHDDSVLSATDIPTIVGKLFVEYYPPTAYNFERKDGIPSFYDANISAAISSIRENMASCGQNGDTFAFITDIHWDPIIQYDNRNTRRSPMLMKKIIEETGVKKVIMGGDYFTASGHASYSDITGQDYAKGQLMDVMRSFTFPNTLLLPIMGNHDLNRYTENASGGVGSDMWDYNAAYSMITKRCEDYGHITIGVDMAYYYDVPSCNTRYIFLNTHDQSGSGDGWIPNRSYSEGTQMYWFRETLNNTPGNYRIVVIQHIYFHIDSDNLPVITNQGTQVAECCDTFNSGSTNETKVVAIICGHAHQDYNSETAGGIPVVMTDCDAYRVTLSGITSERDTVNEQCFDVITLDYTNNKIKTVRIGRGGAEANREIDLYTET